MEPTSDAALPARERILRAASVEFAAHGFAGARVDRVAAAAGLNKERLYAYYGGKRGLFVATVVEALGALDETLLAEAADLPDLAGRMFDHVWEHPEFLRLLTWARLEGAGVWEEAGEQLGGVPAPEARVLEWQRTGVVDASWSADDLFIALLGLCEIWHLTPFASRSGEETRDRRRAFVVHVAQLVGAPR
ncbi:MULTISPECIES: TetR family transcriptional regulator [unclassified Rathayibacter]|uniref:TetR family transcriptional regulator n=1 Tax=unclassified Rathayibacter TaxID=2609250 RepID=UPI000CE766C3|nr:MULTISPECIES: TetR family transcriptional regulator [unclassified Rathayibacter]PPG92050.1 TetR/AcrR family transcriptional regulator [Rathayibacter sp. AY1F3]QHC74585.1 TetR family transcriptional regulator [Rathayibacter sp. VKM Ac-2805]